jgi:hypothetical protein
MDELNKKILADLVPLARDNSGGGDVYDSNILGDLQLADRDLVKMMTNTFTPLLRAGGEHDKIRFCATCHQSAARTRII